MGITGPVASGKTHAAKFFQKCGLFYLDTDKEAKKLYMRPGIAWQLKRMFGYEVFNVEGGLNTKHLASIVFSDVDALLSLEELVFPLLVQETRELINKASARGIYDGIVVEAVKLSEAGIKDLCNLVVAVICERKTQIERLNKQGFSFPRILAFFANQKTNQLFEESADLVIKNDGSILEFETKLEHLKVIIGKNE